MKILAMIMLVLLILAVGFVGYVYKKNAMFLPALFGIGGFPNIKKKDYYQADGTFRKAEKDDKMAFFMQHPVFGGYKHMFFNVEDNVLKAIAPAKYADFLKAQGRSDQMENALEAFSLSEYGGGCELLPEADFYADRPLVPQKGCDSRARRRFSGLLL